MIETTSFRLRDDVDSDDFLAVSAQLQAEFAYAQVGLRRRTMTQSTSDPGRWQEFVLWVSADDADAAQLQARKSDIVASYSALVDHTTIEQHRFEETG